MSDQGISLTIDQYKALLKSIPEINAALKSGGTDIGNPSLLDDDEEAPKLQRKAKAKKENIEATSDEDEE